LSASDRIFAPYPEVVETLTTAGGGQNSGAVHTGSIYVRLVPTDARKTSQQDVMAMWRELCCRNIRVICAPAFSPPADLAVVVPQRRRFNTRFPVRIWNSWEEIFRGPAAQMQSVPFVVDTDTSLVIGNRNCVWRSIGSAPPTWAFVCRISRKH